MLVEQVITDNGIIERNKVDEAIKILRAFEPEEGYWLAHSGGKDSQTVDELCRMAGVKFEAHYSLTTVDPPELVRFIKSLSHVIIDKPKETMWQLIVRHKTPPTRIMRYCCGDLKESSGTGRITLTGVRWDESVNRKNNRNLVNIGIKKNKRTVFNDDNDEARRIVEQCYRTQKTLVNVIIDWTTEEVWEFIRKYNVRYCSLYDEGWERLGCIGCPMADSEKEFNRWPKYKNLYIKAFDRMIKKRIADGLECKMWQTGQEVFDWWVNKSRVKQEKGQTILDEPADI